MVKEFSRQPDDTEKAIAALKEEQEKEAEERRQREKEAEEALKVDPEVTEKAIAALKEEQEKEAEERRQREKELGPEYNDYRGDDPKRNGTSSNFSESAAKPRAAELLQMRREAEATAPNRPTSSRPMLRR